MIDTVAPPVEVAGTLYDSVSPAGSVNTADPVTTPVAFTGLPTVGVPATGGGGDTDTVTTCGAVLIPLEAVMVSVSVVEPVAA